MNSQGGNVRPNVVLITLDACRYDLLVENLDSLPNLKALAGRSVFFENAFSVGPTTFFAFPGLIGGTYPYHWGTGLHRPVRGIDEVLKDAGYNTAVLIGRNPFLLPHFGYGVAADVLFDGEGVVENPRCQESSRGGDRVAGRGRDAGSWRRFERPFPFMGVVRRLGPLWERNGSVRAVGGYILHGSRFLIEYGKGRTPGIQRARQNHAGFRQHLLGFIQQRFRGPQLLWTHIMVSHLPYLTPDQGSRFSDRRTNYLNARGVANFVDRSTCRELKRLYVESLGVADSMVGEILDALSSRGLLDSSIIILTSDHGEEFMEEGTFSHTFESSDILLHVPLMISGGDLVRPKHVEAPVSTIDIPSTVCDLVGVATPDDFRGMSLKPVLGNATVDPSVSQRLWDRPLFSEAWVPRTNLDRRPGYMSHKRVFTVRKNRYKLRVTEVQRSDDTVEEKLELTDWMTGTRLDLKDHMNAVEELRHLLRKHLFEEGVAARNLRRLAEQEHVRYALPRLTTKSLGSAGRRV